MSIIEYNLSLTPKQTIAFDTLEQPDIEELMYGGAKSGGKSVFLCQWAFAKAIQLISLCNIQDQKFPIPVGYIGRKRSVDFRDTTLETWKRFIPKDAYIIRPTEKEIVIDHKVKINYGGMDNQESIAKFNSAEYAFIAIDQAEEITKTDKALLKGTLRLIINGVKPKYKMLFTANPAPCFLKDEYILAPQPYQRFIQALPMDNPYMDKSYIDRLREAFKHRPELVRAYVDGSWDDLEGSDILIQHSSVLKSVGIRPYINNDRRVTSADIARFGNDETVIYNMIDNCIVKAQIYGPKDTTVTAANIINMAADNKSDLIAIDADGLGGPVVDMVRQLLRDKESKMQVFEIRSGKTAERDDSFINSRSEMWFYASKLFYNNEVGIPDDHFLIGQLSSVKYSPNGSKGRFFIEPKIETKKRLDRSPDRADALIYGLWATTKVNKKQYDFKRTDPVPVRNNSYGWQTQQVGAYGW